MTYDQGDLEIMSPSAWHEQLAIRIGNLIMVWTSELGIEVKSCRTMTFKRNDLKSGLEPDNCYYVRNEPLVWDKTELDLASDPPPDLAIEIELTRSALGKMPLYAAFGVPELWRYDGSTLEVFELDQQGQFVRRDTSRVLPHFPIAEAERLLGQVGKDHETAMVRSFQDWVRRHVEAGKGDQSGGTNAR